MLKGFKQFILKGNVVDLAVAVIIGSAFSAVVTALVSDLITPLISAIGGKPNFSNLYFTINHSKFMYGDFLNAFFSFITVAAVIYFFIVLPMNALMNKFNNAKNTSDPTTKKCPECLSVIPQEAKRCAFCTTVLSK